jgi:hypothetical protein
MKKTLDGKGDWTPQNIRKDEWIVVFDDGPTQERTNNIDTHV